MEIDLHSVQVPGVTDPSFMKLNTEHILVIGASINILTLIFNQGNVLNKLLLFSQQQQQKQGCQERKVGKGQSLQ